MKKVIVLIYLFTSFLYCHAELAITLNVETPGSLSSMIASSKKSQITSLTLTGKLNGSDISYIREMAGAGYKGTISSSKCALEYLDISNAVIVSGGSYYAFEHTNAAIGYTDKKYYTEDNSITPFMFDNCYMLDTLLLPNTVTKIYKDAFWEISLVSITLPSCLETFSCIIPSLYLSEIKISESNKYFKVIDGTLYSNDMKTLYRCPVNYSSPTFNIPEGVEYIYESAFYNCKYIKYFEYPTTLKSFGYQSLAWMNLEKFILFPNVKYSRLGYYSSINEVEIKDGFQTFDASVLGRGNWGSETEISVSTVKIHSHTPPTIPDVWHSFGKEVLKGSLYVPKGTYSAYYIAYGWGDFSHIYEMGGGGSNDMAQVRAKAVLIQSMDGQIAISGIDDGTKVYAYEVNGQQVGSAISHNGQANFTTNLNSGSIVIIEVGDRSVKATIK